MKGRRVTASAKRRVTSRSLPMGCLSDRLCETGAGDTAHLKKFGKLLATFGTRMACLLRHLGPECPPRERREAFRLYAKARDDTKVDNKRMPGTPWGLIFSMNVPQLGSYTLQRSKTTIVGCVSVEAAFLLTSSPPAATVAISCRQQLGSAFFCLGVLKREHDAHGSTRPSS